ARTLADAIAIGPLEEAFAGPHFFFASSFADEVPADAAFPALRLFVPRWQVARREDRTVAVANLLITPDVPIDVLAAKVWKAHAKFRAFDYGRAKRRERPSAPKETAELGGDYPGAVAQALQEIDRGDYHKVVLARARRLATREQFHPLSVLNHLRQHYPECYAFSIGNGRGASFIGASPERLVRVAGGRMHTEALAGSAPRGDSASADAACAQALLHSEKDLREHRLVLESIARRVADLGLKLEHAAQPRVLGLANVQHLHLPISATLPAGGQTLDLVAPLLGDSVRVQLELAAHPAAATVDPGQLQQVLLNLLVNARDAMPDGGRLTVCTRAHSDRVVLTITDTGRGMDEAT
ncbi:MAG TPA: chorismate-binding protein, partial [Lacunisphaera sp.]|nr:chorismate-binding protein [Lacunisphaera sp.]